LKDVIRGFGPFEGLGVAIVAFDEGSDIGSERAGATVDTAADFALGDQGKEALDLTESGCACGCQMDVPARPSAAAALQQAFGLDQGFAYR